MLNSLSRFSVAILTLIGISGSPIHAQKESLKHSILDIVSSIDGKVGVAMVSLEKGDTITINGNSRFPMQSVFKFPLAMAVLHQVDQGALSLNQKIHIAKKDLLPNTWSPLQEKYPNGNVDISLSELLGVTVAKSDNNGCDILFRLLGGPKKVEQYIHGLGIKQIAISTNEEEMHKAWNVQYRNWCEPVAMLQILEILHSGKVLSKSSNDFLIQLMTQTTIGAKRIKGLLPEGTIVTHKTGLSDTNAQGITAATNDVGIVTLPNGTHFAIVVYVSNTKATLEKREEVIALIAKAAWDYFKN